MRALNYPVSTTKAPTLVTKTKSWLAILDEQMPQNYLADRHRELLDKRDGEFVTFGRGKNKRVEFIDRGPNVGAVARGLEMAYKLRGSFVAELPVPLQPTTVYNLFYQPTVRAQVTAFEDQLKYAIAHEISKQPHSPAIETEYTDVTGADALAGDATEIGDGDGEESDGA